MIQGTDTSISSLNTQPNQTQPINRLERALSVRDRIIGQHTANSPVANKVAPATLPKVDIGSPVLSPLATTKVNGDVLPFRELNDAITMSQVTSSSSTTTGASLTSNGVGSNQITPPPLAEVRVENIAIATYWPSVDPIGTIQINDETFEFALTRTGSTMAQQINDLNVTGLSASYRETVRPGQAEWPIDLPETAAGEYKFFINFGELTDGYPRNPNAVVVSLQGTLDKETNRQNALSAINSNEKLMEQGIYAVDNGPEGGISLHDPQGRYLISRMSDVPASLGGLYRGSWEQFFGLPVTYSRFDNGSSPPQIDIVYKPPTGESGTFKLGGDLPENVQTSYSFGVTNNNQDTGNPLPSPGNVGINAPLETIGVGGNKITPPATNEVRIDNVAVYGTGWFQINNGERFSFSMTEVGYDGGAIAQSINDRNIPGLSANHMETVRSGQAQIQMPEDRVGVYGLHIRVGENIAMTRTGEAPTASITFEGTLNMETNRENLLRAINSNEQLTKLGVYAVDNGQQAGIALHDPQGRFLHTQIVQIPPLETADQGLPSRALQLHADALRTAPAFFGLADRGDMLPYTVPKINIVYTPRSNESGRLTFGGGINIDSGQYTYSFSATDNNQETTRTPQLQGSNRTINDRGTPTLTDPPQAFADQLEQISATIIRNNSVFGIAETQLATLIDTIRQKPDVAMLAQGNVSAQDVVSVLRD